MNILYVEDDPQDADLTRRFLAESAPHFRLDVVGTQTLAETRLEEKRYDLVLTDLQLPQGDGISLLADIRAKDLPLAVVIITGRGDEDSVFAALRAGADDYIIKREDYLQKLPQTLTNALDRFQDQTQQKSQTIRVLYAEHNQADVDLTLRYLKKVAPHIRTDVVSLGATVLNRLSTAEQRKYDLLLLDYRLPGMNALEVVKEINQAGINIPIILTTGHGDEEIALQALKLGAHDYVVKSEGYLLRLPSILENAVYQKRLADQESRYRTLFQNIPIGLFNLKTDWQYVDANPTLIEMFGFESLDDFQSQNPEEMFSDPADLESLIRELEEFGIGQRVTEMKRQDGTYFWGEILIIPIKDSPDEVLHIQGSVNDITDRKMMENELKSYTKQLQSYSAGTRNQRV